MVTTIAELIAAEYADAALPVLKDPRICRLAPLYCAALDRLGYATHAVIPRRHPAAAAGSLNTRDGTPPETAELLHIRELLGAEYHTRLLPRAWCDFDDLLADWRRHTADIATSLRLHWPIHPDAAAPAIDAFLTPALRHHTAATGPAAGPLAMRLHTACHAGDEPTLRSEFDAVRAVTDELDRLTHPWQSAWRHRLATLAAPVGGTPPPG